MFTFTSLVTVSEARDGLCLGVEKTTDADPALGLRHEHQRPDRDQYFNLDCSKLAPAPPSNTPAKCGVPCEGWGCQFAAIDNPDIFNFEGPYDTSSIMHYEEYLFATDWTQPALTGVVPGVRVTAGERPSLMDAVRVCEMYGDLCKGICGDGILAPGNQEECDPGCEGVDTATCTAGCKLTQAVCGNNIVEPGEACDDGPSGSATCSATCQLLPVCGNNVVEMDEECDDGPAGSATCSPTCRTISCIATCDPDPNYNGCDITTSCIAVEGGSAASQGKHYCACRHGFKAPEGVDQMRLPWYSPISQEGRVFVPPGQACNVLCDDWTLGRDGCKGVDERPMCY
jgi:cysteine-rich repeat protein